MKTNVGDRRHLIELLLAGVLIAAVALAVIIVDLRATGRARQLLCVGHAHQLTLALRQYADDHDGRLPIGPYWQAATSAYAEQPKQPQETLFVCPARPNDPGFAYGLNCELGGRRADIVEQNVWLVEVRNGTPEIWWANDIRFLKLRNNRFPMTPHNGRTTHSRGDGSVRTRDPFELQAADWFAPSEWVPIPRKKYPWDFAPSRD